ncbi:MAG TPA: cullin [Gammaproteobacteria bacterium]|nr:cullin [Gammaproteobacteria bacterium]
MMAEIIAQGLDQMIRKATADVDYETTQVIRLLHRIQDKDVFNEEYRKLFARRLLDRQFKLDEDLERRVIQIIKVWAALFMSLFFILRHVILYIIYLS